MKPKIDNILNFAKGIRPKRFYFVFCQFINGELKIQSAKQKETDSTDNTVIMFTDYKHEKPTSKEIETALKNKLDE